MENTTIEKLYLAELKCEELYGFIKVPIYLFKRDLGDLMNINQLLRSASNFSGMTKEQIKCDFTVAQLYFTEDEIKELKKYFKDKEDVKPLIKEVSPPAKLEEGLNLIPRICDGDILHGIFCYKDEGRVLSYKLEGYYCCWEGLKKDCKKVKVWISTSNDYPGKGVATVSCLAQGELTYEKYLSCLPDEHFWVGEIDEILFEEVKIALSANFILDRFFRLLNPIEDDHPFSQLKNKHFSTTLKEEEVHP